MACSSYRFLDRALLSFQSQHHTTALPSPKRYGNRYEREDPGRTSENALNANFVELRKGELRRIPLLQASVNRARRRAEALRLGPYWSWRSVPTAPAAARGTPLHVGRQWQPSAASRLRWGALPAGAASSVPLPALPCP